MTKVAPGEALTVFPPRSSLGPAGDPGVGGTRGPICGEILKLVSSQSLCWSGDEVAMAARRQCMFVL